MGILINAVIATSLLALLFSLVKRSAVLAMPRGNKKMVEISDLIHNGAMAFLNAEYRVMAVFVAVVAILLYIFFGIPSAMFFVFGAVLSAIAGNIGMRTATSANSRTTQASMKSVKDGFQVAFASGSVMGFAVVGLGLFGVTICYLLFNDPSMIYSFGFGASLSVILFKLRVLFKSFFNLLTISKNKFLAFGYLVNNCL